jgi:hypothetical protein
MLKYCGAIGMGINTKILFEYDSNFAKSSGNNGLNNSTIIAEIIVHINTDKP